MTTQDRKQLVEESKVLAKQLLYQGRQYSNGQYARGGGHKKDWLTECGEHIEQLVQALEQAERKIEKLKKYIDDNASARNEENHLKTC